MQTVDNKRVTTTRPAGLEPATYGLEILRSVYKCLSLLFLYAFFGVKNHLYTQCIVVVDYPLTDNRIKSDARMTPELPEHIKAAVRALIQTHITEIK